MTWTWSCIGATTSTNRPIRTTNAARRCRKDCAARCRFKLALTRARLEAERRFVSSVERPAATAATLRLFVVETDRPGARLASG